MNELLPYQQAAKAAIYNHLRTRSDNPCVILPTGSGSLSLIRSICQDGANRNGRALILLPTDESAIPVVNELRHEFDRGIDNTGTNGSNPWQNVQMAIIEAIDRGNREIDAVDTVILHQAHLIPPHYDKLYQQFLTESRAVNPHMRTVGIAAVAYRLSTTPSRTAEPICTGGGYLDDICFSISYPELIDAGFLCPAITKAAIHAAETSTLPAYGGEFVSTEAVDLLEQPGWAEAACAELVASTRDRRAVLIFAADNINAMRIVGLLKKRHEIEAGLVWGSESFKRRSELSSQFREGRLKYVVLMDGLTCGFDAPRVDTVVLMRPTLSPGLYSYMVGQGLRLHPQKKNCLVLDFVGNALHHGPIEQFAGDMQGGRTNRHPRAQACPGCRTVVADGCDRCPDCRNELPPVKHRRVIEVASNWGPPAENSVCAEYPVSDTLYEVHRKQHASPDAPKSMRVNYRVSTYQWRSEFICFEHAGYPREKAVEWWQQRSVEPVPSTAEDAVASANGGGLVRTERITVQRIAGEKFDRIIAYELGPLPE